MAAGDARQASIAAQRKKKQPRSGGARVVVPASAPVSNPFHPQTVQQILGVKPAPKKPTAPNRAPYRPGYAPEQVDDNRPIQAAPSNVGRDPRVVDVQTQLRAMGYNVAVDGIMGPQTRAAIAMSNNGTVRNAVHSVDHSKDRARNVVAHEAATETVRQARVSGNHRSRTPFVQGQEPSGYEAVFVGPDGKEVAPGHRPPLGARIHQVPYYTAPRGPVGDEATQMSPADLAEAARFKEKEIGLPGVILQETLQGLVPTRVAHKIENGQAPSLGDVASDTLNGALWLTPGAVAPSLRAARAGVTALREEGASRAALGAIRESLGASRSVQEDALALKRAQAAARAEQKAEGAVVSPIRDELEQALAQAPNITPKQRKAILEANDVNARAVANTLGNGTTPEQAYQLMWRGANFHDVSPTIHEVGDVLAQTGKEPEIANVARTPEAYTENPVAIEKASRNLPRSAALREAAPPHAKTPKQIKALLTDLQRRAIEAADYRQWYARSAAGILSHVGGDTTEADKIAALIAVYSPRAEVYSKSTEWNNLDRALNAYDEYMQTGKVSPRWSISSHKEGEGDWQTFRAQQILEGNFEWQGLKTNRFYRNFLQHIDPEKYKALFGDEKFTTIDTWMRRAFGYPAIQKTEERATLFGTEHVPVGKKQEPITPKMYDFMDRATKAVADSLGWTPEEAQAAIWTSIKAEAEGTPLENAGFDFMDAFAHREARRARPLKPEQFALDMEAATSDVPRKSAVQAAIDASRKPDDGFTLTAGLNPDTGRDGYAVAYGAHEYREAAPLTEKGLLDFRNKHLSLLRSDPSLRVGGWHNPDDGQVYLDISRVFPTLDDAIAFGREQGQLAIFDRANMDVIPTGLSAEQADSIKGALKEEGRLREQAAKYDDLLDRAYASLAGKDKKTLTAAERKDAEQYLFDWAAKNPDGKYEQAFYDLAHDAALGRSARDPDLLFQDDALVQRIGEEHGRPVDKEKILAEHAGDDLRDLPKGRRSNKDAQDIAKSYMRDSKLPYTPPTEYAKVDPDRARRIAEWYDQAVDAPHDPTVRAAYDAMAQETLEQYRAIQRAGYRFEFYPEGFDPYPSGPSAAIDDLRSNKHMYVFPTDEGFGSLTEAQQAHPLLADSGERWGGKTVTHNDIFRAVHDFFGHYKEGVGFRAAGEENAWRSHSAMYSPEARRAMTAETRGQNSWVNYGPHGEANRTAKQGETVYADQKAVLAPDWVVNEGSGQPLMQEGDAVPSTFPEWWGDNTPTGSKENVVEDARNWLADLQWRNMDEEQIQELPDDVVLKAIDRMYDGGMEQFINDGMYFEDRPSWLTQASPKVKGAVERTAKGAILHLFAGADTSTALHELAHAVEPLMPEASRVALRVAALEHGAQSYDEFVARSMERYFLEGVAPTRGLRRTFRTLGSAMQDIYGIAERIPGGALDPEIRNVFDRWYAREAHLDPGWAAQRALQTIEAPQRAYSYTDEHAPDAKTLWHNGQEITIAEANRRLGEGNPFHIHVRDSEGNLVGARHGTDNGDHVHLASVYVKDEHRGQGIATRLSELVRRHAGERPISSAFINPALRDREVALSRAAGRDVRTEEGTGLTFYQEEGRDPMLDAAAVQAKMMGATDDAIRQTADMFKVDEAKLRAHMADMGGAMDRILSNADVGAGPAETEKTVEEYLGKWLNQEETPPEFGEESLANTHEPVSDLSPTDQLLKGIRGAASQYGVQSARRAEERAARAKEVAKALRTIEDPDEAMAAASAAMKGEYAKIDFQGLKNIDAESLRALKSHVNKNVDFLPPFAKVRLNRALDDAVVLGRLPTPSDMLLIERVFGKTTAVGIAQHAGTWGDMIINIFNIPRSLMATADFSAVGRQALVAGASHPVLWGRSFPTMFKSMKSGEFYGEAMQQIKDDPLYPLALSARVSFTDIGEKAPLTAHEESFASDLAANALDKIPGVPNVIKGSARAYVSFLNKLRMDMFKQQIRMAMAAGTDVNDEKFLHDIGDIINAATGRGTIHGRAEHLLPALNTFLFSPRLMLSRLNYLDPTWYFRLGHGLPKAAARQVRIEALKGLFATTGAVMSTLWLFSNIPGVDVGSLDPRSSDFGKLRFGDTRIDVAGGFQQYIRLASELLTNVKVSSTTGEKIHLGSGYGVPTRLDETLNFGFNKLAPAPGIAVNLFRGHDAVGNPVTPKSIALSNFTPLIFQDAKDLYHARGGGLNGLAYAAGGWGLSSFGFGMQTYKANDPGKKKADKLTKQAEDAGLPKPPKEILLALDHKANLDSLVQQHKGDRLAQLKSAIQYYKKTTGKHDLDRAYAQAKQAPQLADTFMEVIRTVLVGPGLSAYEGAIKAATEAKGNG